MLINEAEIDALLARYEAASNSRDFAAVAEMIHPDATFRFTEGDFVGIDAIRGAFEKTWAQDVRDERYCLTDVSVVTRDSQSASIAFTFTWSGEKDGRSFRSRAVARALLSEPATSFNSSTSI